MKNKLISLLLALCLVMALVPMTAFAEENEKSSKISITTAVSYTHLDVYKRQQLSRMHLLFLIRQYLP